MLYLLHKNNFGSRAGVSDSYISVLFYVRYMESGYRSLGPGLLIAVLVLSFTFLTSLIAASLQSYNLAISAAFIMGGLFSFCLACVLRAIHVSGINGIRDSPADRLRAKESK